MKFKAPIDDDDDISNLHMGRLTLSPRPRHTDNSIMKAARERRLKAQAAFTAQMSEWTRQEQALSARAQQEALKSWDAVRVSMKAEVEMKAKEALRLMYVHTLYLFV
jgi:hypothetical protein